MQQALDGIRVLDLSEGIAGPAGAKFLADFGAQVIKVEPPAGDWARRCGPFPGDLPDLEQSAQFTNYNRNKIGITLDVFDPRGRALLDRLIADADILITSYSPAQLENLRLDYESLRSVNAAIVVVAVTPWGLTGPYRDYRATELLYDAFGHSMSAFGVRDREPLALGGGLRQHYAGRFVALAAMAAQMSAEQSGTGQLVDLSIMETVTGSADRRALQLIRFAYTRRLFYRQASGIGTGNIRGGFHLCGDGWIHLALRPQDVVPLGEITGHPEWATDPRLQPIAQKFADPQVQEELSIGFLGWAMQHTRREIDAIAREHRLPIYPVNHFSDVLTDEHLREREFFVEETHPVIGTDRYPGPPFRMERGGYAQRRPAPLLGQHNSDVLSGLLGLSPEELRELEAAGVIASSEAARLHAGVAPAHLAPAHPPRVSRTLPHLPLEGVRVLDMTAVWAGPSATMLLADLGAEVIRVESIQFAPVITRCGVIRPESYEELEGYANPFFNAYVDFYPGKRPWNRFGGFNAINRNKRSVTADLRRPEGVEIFKQLVAISDVVIDNYAFGVMEKLGLGDAPLRAVNPRLINVSMPLYGNSGPLRATAGMGSVVDAWSGFLTMRGYRDFSIGAAQATTHMDSASGPGTAFAVICALRERERSGLGQFIDFAQSENMMQSVGEYFLDAQWNRRDPQPLGNRDRWGGIQGLYRCQGIDHWIALTISTDEEWRSFARAIGDPEWARDPRFATAAQRRALHDEIDARITEWSCTMYSEDAMHWLQAAGVPAARLLNEREAFEDPHLNARGFFLETTQADSGTHRYPGHQWKMLGTPLRNERPSPLLGEDNEYVYKELLGCSEEEYQHFVDEQHIGMDYLPGLTPGR